MSVTVSPLAAPRPARRAIAAVVALSALLLVPGAALAAKPITGPARDIARIPVQPMVKPSTKAVDRLIVTYRPGTTVAARTRIRGTAGATFVRHLRLVDADVIRPAGGSLAAAMTAL